VIFKPGLIEKILSGKKTQTRQPVKPNHILVCRFDPSRTTTKVMHAMRYVPGRDYAIKPGRTSAGVARVLIQDLRLEQLGDITPAAAVAEGFKRTDEFFAYWERIHRVVDLRQWVWVFSFELISEQRTRYLGPRGYTENPRFALREGPDSDPEVREWAPDAGWQSEHSRRRRAAFEEERERELDQRLADALNDAADQGLDINRHRAAIMRRVEALERDVRKAKTRSRAA
jgi:hypothetical protein